MLITKVEGLEELELALITLADNFRYRGEERPDLVLRATAVKAMKRAMEPVASAVLAKAPYDEKNTGPVHLRDTVRLDARTPNATDRKSDMVNLTDVVVSVVSVKKSAVSLSQEFGNAVTPPHPYLRNALTANHQQAIDIFKSEMEPLLVAFAERVNKAPSRRK